MSTDTIDAADILVTELSEQAALLSESGVTALSSGHLLEAKLIIEAIEKTHALREQAEQLKAEIATLHAVLMPSSPREHDEVTTTPAPMPEHANRKQDRTDPTEMQAKKQKILTELEAKFNTRLQRRSAALYRGDRNQIGIVCAMSKWHTNNENYWYAYHTHQDEFLSKVGHGYLVLGMMDVDDMIVLPLEVLRKNLNKLNTTTTPERLTYWHIHVSRAGGKGLSLLRARGEPPLPLDRYVVNLGAPSPAA